MSKKNTTSDKIKRNSDPLGLKGFPRTKTDKKGALKAAHAIRKDIEEYIREYNVPFPVMR